MMTGSMAAGSCCSEEDNDSEYFPQTQRQLEIQCSAICIYCGYLKTINKKKYTS